MKKISFVAHEYRIARAVINGAHKVMWDSLAELVGMYLRSRDDKRFNVYLSNRPLKDAEMTLTLIKKPNWDDFTAVYCTDMGREVEICHVSLNDIFGSTPKKIYARFTSRPRKF